MSDTIANLADVIRSDLQLVIMGCLFWHLFQNASPVTLDLNDSYASPSVPLMFTLIYVVYHVPSCHTLCSSMSIPASVFTTLVLVLGSFRSS